MMMTARVRTPDATRGPRTRALQSNEIIDRVGRALVFPARGRRAAPGSRMYRDAYITEVMVTLKGTYADRMEEALKQLRGAGMHVDHADDDMSMVEGSIEAGSVGALEELDAVQYVRKMHTYAAEYPKGDPRDRNQDSSSADVLPPAPTRRLGKRYP